VSCVIGKTPDDIPPALTFGEDKGFVRRFIGKSAALSKFFSNVFVRRFWYMAFYSVSFILVHTVTVT
jgi:solute carrier family 6 GABA transporter-like protein 1